MDTLLFIGGMDYKKAHRLTGLILALFIAAHLLNHAMSLFGPRAHIDFMNALRGVYRHPLVEPVLLGVVLAHLASGLRLAIRKRKTAMTGFDRLQVGSGLYLAGFLGIHLTAVLAGRYWLNLDTNFYFGVAGLNTFPLNLFFVPYYGLAIMAVVGHLAAVHARKMKRSVGGLTPSLQARILLVLGLLLTLLIFYGLTNGFRGVEIPEEYEVLTGRG